jgi:ribose 5-phosphate isomerase B
LRIAFGSDEKSHVTDFVEQQLRTRGHDLQLFGPLADNSAGDPAWPDVAEKVAQGVASGRYDEGILFCWTGTGVAMAANKVPGIRAALCGDAETARGAKAWNQANVLCLSLRTTTETVAREILDAWFSTPPDPSEDENVKKISAMDVRYRSASKRSDDAPSVAHGVRKELTRGRQTKRQAETRQARR